MHTPTGKNLPGFLLSLSAAVLWGLLPIAIKEVIISMDAFTLVWYRFFIALIILFFYLLFVRRLPAIARVKKTTGLLLLAAAIGLCLNYVLFSYSLNFVNAETSEALIQLTSLFLLLGGVFIYREPFSRVQQIGALCIVMGMVLFFNDRFAEMFKADSSLGAGVLILVLSALGWTVYALIQKHLLFTLSSVQILFLIYLLATLMLLPFSGPATLFDLTSVQLWLLLFCCLNTVVAYGCFAEALAHWHASKVSAVIALAPLFTIAGLKLLIWIVPDYPFTDHLNLLSLFAAVLLVLGSATVALVPLYRAKSLAAAEPKQNG